MLLENVDRLDLESYWSEEDPSLMHRGKWVVYSETGADATAATYFEIDPGKHIGSHTHDAEETIFVLEGFGEVVVGDERENFDPGAVVFVPDGIPHDVHNGGQETFRAISFFPKAEVSSTFEVVLQPEGSRKLGSPGAD